MIEDEIMSMKIRHVLRNAKQNPIEGDFYQQRYIEHVDYLVTLVEQLVTISEQGHVALRALGILMKTHNDLVVLAIADAESEHDTRRDN